MCDEKLLYIEYIWHVLQIFLIKDKLETNMENLFN